MEGEERTVAAGLKEGTEAVGGRVCLAVALPPLPLLPLAPAVPVPVAVEVRAGELVPLLPSSHRSD